MRAVIQRVRWAEVEVENSVVGKIGAGLLVYLGIHQDDSEELIPGFLDKIKNLRLFPDQDGRFASSLADNNFEILLISQFTLYADTRKGRRPSMSEAAPPAKAKAIYESFLQQLSLNGIRFASGIFGAHMLVRSENDGPVTLQMDFPTQA